MSMIATEIDNDRLSQAIDRYPQLQPRDALILAMRRGEYDGETHTLREIGQAMDLTASRIGQLAKRAEETLRGEGP